MSGNGGASAIMISQKHIEDIEGVVLPIQGVSQDETSLTVRLENQFLVMVPIRYLQRKNEDRYFLAMSFRDLEKAPQPAETTTIPVIEETPVIRKRKVDTEQVRIRKSVQETPKVIEESLAREEIRIERKSVNELRQEPAQPRTEGNVYIIPVQEEILVVEKKILVREEIRIEKVHVQHNEKVTVNLRSEEVTIDRKKIN
jgi:uncharacterized protein (TIGR02271 family)